METIILNLSAVGAMVPAALQALRRMPARDTVFWGLLCLAAAAALARAGVLLTGPWQTGFAATLWITVAATSVLFLAVARLVPQAWRLAPLVTCYMIILGILATVWQHVPGRPITADPSEGSWFVFHIITATLTYALVTLAAIAALAAFLQERALKRKRPTALTRLLPPVADCDRLVVGLLVAGEAVLAFGLATGIALNWRETGDILTFDHKTVLTIATFAVIGFLLVAHFGTGMRGRRAARVVLVAYALLTLGHPGVKFVTDVLMA